MDDADAVSGRSARAHSIRGRRWHAASGGGRRAGRISPLGRLRGDQARGPVACVAQAGRHPNGRGRQFPLPGDAARVAHAAWQDRLCARHRVAAAIDGAAPAGRQDDRAGGSTACVAQLDGAGASRDGPVCTACRALGAGRARKRQPPIPAAWPA